MAKAGGRETIPRAQVLSILRLGPQMKRSVTNATSPMLGLAVAGCSGPRATRAMRAKTKRRARQRRRSSGTTWQGGVSPPPNFRLVVSSDRRWRTGWRSPQCVRRTEVTVSATYSSKIGSVNDAPKTFGDSGATCNTQSDQTEIPEAVILCANR